MMQNTLTPTQTSKADPFAVVAHGGSPERVFRWLFSYYNRYARGEVDQGYKMLRPEWLRLREDAPVGLSMRDVARMIEGLPPKQWEVIERERERAERAQRRMAHKIGVRLAAQSFGSKER